MNKSFLTIITFATLGIFLQSYACEFLEKEKQSHHSFPTFTPQQQEEADQLVAFIKSHPLNEIRITKKNLDESATKLYRLSAPTQHAGEDIIEFNLNPLISIDRLLNSETRKTTYDLEIMTFKRSFFSRAFTFQASQNSFTGKVTKNYKLHRLSIPSPSEQEHREAEKLASFINRYGEAKIEITRSNPYENPKKSYYLSARMDPGDKIGFNLSPSISIAERTDRKTNKPLYDLTIVTYESVPVFFVNKLQEK